MLAFSSQIHQHTLDLRSFHTALKGIMYVLMEINPIFFINGGKKMTKISEYTHVLQLFSLLEIFFKIRESYIF